VADALRRRFEGLGFSAHLISGGSGDLVAFDEPSPARMFSYRGALDFVNRLAATVPLQVKVLPHGEGLPLPTYETAGAAGMDLRAALTDADYTHAWAPEDKECVILSAGEFRLIPTGVSLAIPEGYEVQVRPRSGLAAKSGISIVNSPGTVDCDYRGEIKVCLINLSKVSFRIKRGDRIAQMVLAPVSQARWSVVDDLPESARGASGFGSTGK
jgi:dUTP pyrophosphatase